MLSHVKMRVEQSMKELFLKIEKKKLSSVNPNVKLNIMRIGKIKF